jgi:hypothetical protein
MNPYSGRTSNTAQIPVNRPARRKPIPISPIKRLSSSARIGSALAITLAHAPEYSRQRTPDTSLELVESSGSVLFPGENENNVAPNGLLTLVVAKQGNEWRIVSFHNTPTGRFRKVRFIGRFVLSRLSTFHSRTV